MQAQASAEWASSQRRHNERKSTGHLAAADAAAPLLLLLAAIIDRLSACFSPAATGQDECCAANVALRVLYSCWGLAFARCLSTKHGERTAAQYEYPQWVAYAASQPRQTSESKCSFCSPPNDRPACAALMVLKGERQGSGLAVFRL